MLLACCIYGPDYSTVVGRSQATVVAEETCAVAVVKEVHCWVVVQGVASGDLPLTYRRV